jgi:hypothetical protein
MENGYTSESACSAAHLNRRCFSIKKIVFIPTNGHCRTLFSVQPLLPPTKQLQGEIAEGQIICPAFTRNQTTFIPAF